MGKRKGDREFWESAELNKASYIQYYDRLTELSISMFEWRNLPDTVDQRFLELTLFANGMAVFFKDEDDYLALQCAISGPLNVYRIPIRRRAYAVNGFNRELDNTNSVIIYNNMLHKNSMLDVRMFARELYNLDRAISVNANAQKTPILIRCTENERLSLENVYMDFDGNKPIIYGDKQLNPNALSVLKTDAPYVADKLYTLKTQKWNEALTYLGISNVNITKRERLITDEVTRNQGGTIASRYSRLESRRNACKEINKMFGLDIQCDFRQDYREADDEVMIEGDTDTSETKEMDDMFIDIRTN